MTIEEFQAYGFAVSSHITQGQIDQAEYDVTNAYVLPIFPDYREWEESDERMTVVYVAVLYLTFYLLLQRSIVATRTGAKEKVVQNSRNATILSQLEQGSKACHLRIEEMRRLDGADTRAEIFDIIGIYFKSNYVSL